MHEKLTKTSLVNQHVVINPKWRIFVHSLSLAHWEYFDQGFQSSGSQTNLGLFVSDVNLTNNAFDLIAPTCTLCLQWSPLKDPQLLQVSPASPSKLKTTCFNHVLNLQLQRPLLSQYKTTSHSIWRHCPLSANFIQTAQIRAVIFIIQSLVNLANIVSTKSNAIFIITICRPQTS